MGVLLMLLTSCATVPPAIRYAPPGDLQLPEARANPDVHTGRPVRWGGTIVSVQNKEAETILEVLQKASQVHLWQSYRRYGYYPDYPRFRLGFGFDHRYRHGHGLYFGFHHFFYH
jgi:Outer membrane lipoprotein Slp family